MAGEGLKGMHFKAKVDVVESMGSEFYAYFVVEAAQVSARELEELAQDTGAADLGQSRGGSQVVARLAAESRVTQGAEAELWFNTQHLQLFDPESGQSLLSTDGAATPSQAAAGAAPA